MFVITRNEYCISNRLDDNNYITNIVNILAIGFHHLNFVNADEGIAGVGDLATTCFSPDGRNRACGEAIARGWDLSEYVESQHCVVEGVPTLQSVLEGSRTLHVDLPIMNAVGRVFLGGEDPRSAIHDLMTRPSGVE